MNPKTTISATEARAKFFDILEKIEKAGTPITITVNGVPRAVLMNAEDFDSWAETLEIMSDPELVKSIEESKKELREGKYVTLDEMMEEEGLTFVRDKAKNEYSVVRVSKKK